MPREHARFLITLSRDNTHPGLGDGGCGEAFGLGVARVGHRVDDRGHRRLVVLGVGAGRPSGALEQVARREQWSS